MSLSSLRELLIRKTSDSSLVELLKTLPDDALASHVTESLQKMSNNAGTKANHALNHFNSHIHEDSDGFNLEGEMLRDALGHHLSHYKSALRENDRGIADKHLSQVVNLMHLANKLHTISGGKIRVGSGDDGYGSAGPMVQPSSWEMNYTSDKRTPDGRLHQLPKGWGRDTSKADSMFPDYRFLEMAPHPSSNRSDVKKHTDQAYPFHELRVNDKYVHIEDKPHQAGEFTPHEFDSHPVVGHHDIEQKRFGEPQKQSYKNQYMDFEHGGQAEKWLTRHEAESYADPEKYFSRGSEPSAPIHPEPNNNHAMARPYHKTAGHPDIWSKEPKAVKTMSLDDED